MRGTAIGSACSCAFYAWLQRISVCTGASRPTRWALRPARSDCTGSGDSRRRPAGAALWPARRRTPPPPSGRRRYRPPPPPHGTRHCSPPPRHSSPPQSAGGADDAGAANSVARGVHTSAPPAAARGFFVSPVTMAGCD